MPSTKAARLAPEILTPAAARARATALLRPWVERLGLGFHPDTRGRCYAAAGGGYRSFADAEADRYDADVRAAREAYPDVYEAALDLWVELGFLTAEEVARA